MANPQLTAVRYILTRDQLEVIAQNSAGELYQMLHALTIDLDDTYVDEDYVSDLVFFSNRKSTNIHGIEWIPYEDEAFEGIDFWVEVLQKEPVEMIMSRSRRVLERGKKQLAA